MSSIVVLIEIADVVKAPTTLYVGGGPGNYSKIQDAINAANDGDLVFVYNGSYKEYVTVNKTISLIGENKNSTIIDGGENWDVVRIMSDFVNMTGFTVANSGKNPTNEGIQLFYVQNCSINNNILTNNRVGICIDYSDNNSIKNNEFVFNSNVGLSLKDSHKNQIKNNTFNSNMVYGISHQVSSHTNITGNVMINCGISMQGTGIENWNTHHIDTTNIVNGKSVYYWKNKNGGTVPLAAGQVILANCTYINVEKQKIGNVTNGIMLGYCSNSNISANVITTRSYGIFFIESNEIYITNNTILSNTRCMWIGQTSVNNHIYHNNFDKPGDDRTNNGNQWDNGYPSGGNFWLDYTGIDLNSTPSQNVPPPDGIGDTPYEIDSDSRDNYPLMVPLGNYTQMYKGWNLVSVPKIQQVSNIHSYLSFLDGFYNAVQWYKTNDSLDLWKSNHTLKLHHLNDLDHLDHSMGFWIHITKPNVFLLEYPGTEPTSNQTIQIHEGWNMVGYPSLSNHNRTNGLNNLEFNTDVDVIQWYDAATKTWHFMGPDDSFVPGRGYWIHSKVDTTWEVPL
jgi:parallel beta-helix repeat protein